MPAAPAATRLPAAVISADILVHAGRKFSDLHGTPVPHRYRTQPEPCRTLPSVELGNGDGSGVQGMRAQRIPANLVASADLSISKTDGQTSAAPGGSHHLHYPGQQCRSQHGEATPASTDSFAAELELQLIPAWRPAASAATRPPALASIADTLLLPAGSSVTYTAYPVRSIRVQRDILSNTANVSSARQRMIRMLRE